MQYHVTSMIESVQTGSKANWTVKTIEWKGKQYKVSFLVQKNDTIYI